MLSGIAGVPTAEEQKKAAEAVFARYPGIKIVAKEYTGWSPTKAKSVAASLVGRNVDAIWSDSAISDLGVVEAYQAAGKPIPPLTGDSSNAFLRATAGKNVQFALSSFPAEMSEKCLDIALDAVQGKPVPNFVNVDSTVFTNKQAGKYVRKDCSNDLWVPSTMPADLLKRLKLC
jgi:ribose transport system substrate-binding protein